MWTTPILRKENAGCKKIYRKLKKRKERKAGLPVVNKPTGSYMNHHTAKHSKKLFLFKPFSKQFKKGFRKTGLWPVFPLNLRSLFQNLTFKKSLIRLQNTPVFIHRQDIIWVFCIFYGKKEVFIQNFVTFCELSYPFRLNFR
jgi:hypothetical protein